MQRKRLLAALAAASATVAVAATTHADASTAPHTIKPGGTVHVGAPRHVNLSALPSGGTVHAWNHAPLLRSGQFSGTHLRSAPTIGTKSGAVAPNAVTATKSPFNGIDLAASNCGCQPPDVNAAIGPKNIVESVNLDLAVYTKTGVLKKSTSLNTFLGTTDSLSDPRVVYDPTWDRWALSLTDITAVGATPTLWFAVSATGNPAGSWIVYHPGFGGGFFPAGELLDYPVLGMDADSFIITTNNFAQPSAGNFTYNGSTAIAFPKARVYNAYGFSAPAFGVPFGTSPAVVGGRPTQNSGKTYLLDTDDANNLMHVYYMTNTGRPDSTTLVNQANIAYSWAAPPRGVNQPGTSVTLDPLDGRVDWAPTQLDNRVWFAHGAAVGTFPAVNYGFVDIGANTISFNTAFHSSTSDDFNPSIAAQNGPNGVQAVLSWATTDTPAGIATRDYAAVQVGTTLAHQSGIPFGPAGSSTSEFRFGDYSSVSPEYNAVGTCGEGSYALVANQYFEPNGNWTTRISQIGFC